MLRLQSPLPEDYTDRVARRARRHGSRPPRPPSATGSSSSATTTSATRSCAGPTPGATRSACRCSPSSGPRPTTSSSAACTSWPSRPTCSPTTDQQVILPDLNAGCSMADMADIDSVEEAWEALEGVIDIDRVVPITYMNSSAALKAFVGRNGGAVCTSTNARAVLEWAFRAQADGGAAAEGALLPRPAPRPQHRPGHGLHPRRHAGLGPAQGPGRARPRPTCKERHLPAVEGPLLGAPAVPARARGGLPARSIPTASWSSTPSAATTSCQLADQVGSTDFIIRAVAGRAGRRRASASAPRSTS